MITRAEIEDLRADPSESAVTRCYQVYYRANGEVICETDDCTFARITARDAPLGPDGKKPAVRWVDVKQPDKVAFNPAHVGKWYLVYQPFTNDPAYHCNPTLYDSYLDAYKAGLAHVQKPWRYNPAGRVWNTCIIMAQSDGLPPVINTVLYPTEIPIVPQRRDRKRAMR